MVPEMIPHDMKYVLEIWSGFLLLIYGPFITHFMSENIVAFLF